MVDIGFMACFDREYFPDFETFAFESDQTLLEYDLVLWDMAFLHFGYYLEHGNRVRELKRLLRDRRRRLSEIEALMKNGKSLVILSPDPDAFYFETEKGLLRSDANSEIEKALQSEKMTRNFIDIYSFLPPDIEERVRENAVVARGKKMDFSGDAAFIESWKTLKDTAWYNSYFLKPIGTPFLYVKGTQYPVASWLRYSNGSIFFVPGTEYDDSSDYPVFVEAAKILVNAVDRLSGNTVDLFWSDSELGPESDPSKERSDEIYYVHSTRIDAGMWDVFISHAWEDKEALARPLAEALEREGFRVWYDEFTLRVGDSLRRSIDHGLANSRYGVVILSPNFFAKEWPQKELDGLAAREVSGEKVILPVWHKVTADQVRKYSLTLADRVAVSSDHGLEYVVERLFRAIEPAPKMLESPDEADDSSDETFHPFGIAACPSCGSGRLKGSSFIHNDRHYFTLRCEECGWSTFTE